MTSTSASYAFAPLSRTAARGALVDSTACESAFAVTASRPDSLAELTRHAILLQGAFFPGTAQDKRDEAAQQRK